MRRFQDGTVLDGIMENARKILREIGGLKINQTDLKSSSSMLLLIEKTINLKNIEIK